MAIERVREAIAKWKQIEELDERRKTALQQKAGYEKNKELIDSIDVAQLPRTAALIRQIAYVSAEPLARRQVLIVSHHEDLTNRLLDFLIPPEGRELRILNFVDWDISKGPSIEQGEVIPGLRASQESRRKFADTLKSILNTND